MKKENELYQEIMNSGNGTRYSKSKIIVPIFVIS